MKIHILESLRFCRFFLNRNVDQFIFIFFKEYFSITLVLEERCLGLKIIVNFQDFILSGQPYRLEDTKRNALDISDVWNQVHHIMFWGSRWQICLERLRVIIYINLQAASRFFPKKNNYCFPNQEKFDKKKKISNKRLELFIEYLFRPILWQILSAVKASLVVIYIIFVKNIIFTFQKQRSESVAKYNLLK